MPYQGSNKNMNKNGQANYNSWTQLTEELANKIFSEEGADLGPDQNPGKNERFAQLVYVVNGDDTSGTISTSNAISMPDQVANPNIIQLGGIAEDTIPTEVSDGNSVALWVDTFGRLVNKSFNFTENADNVVVQNQASLSRLEPTINLNAVTATGAGTSINGSGYHNYTFIIVASSVSTGGTVLIQHSLDGVNWRTIDTHNIVADGVYQTDISNKAFLYLRTNLSVRTDGTYTTISYFGN